MKAKIQNALINIYDFCDLDPVTNFVINQYNTNPHIKENTFSFQEDNVNYIIEENKIIINYKNIKFEIEKFPYKFYLNEKKDENFCGQTYSKDVLKKIFNNIQLYETYTLFINNKKITNINQILETQNREIIIFDNNVLIYYQKFIFLNNKNISIENKESSIFLNQKELSPIPFEEINYINENEQFNLILESRLEFIKFINEFIKSKNETELIIFGSDGIGKTVSFLFLNKIYYDYKILYFNVKKLTSDFRQKHILFKYEIMRYYTTKEVNDITQNNFKIFLIIMIFKYLSFGQ